MDHLQTALDIVGYSLPKHKFKTLVADFRGKFVNEGINQALFIEVKNVLKKFAVVPKFGSILLKIILDISDFQICTSLHKGDVVRRSRKASIAKEGKILCNK